MFKFSSYNKIFGKKTELKNGRMRHQKDCTNAKQIIDKIVNEGGIQ